MALTKKFKETVIDRINRDPEFKNALFQEALEEFLTGNLDVAKSLLRDYINATVSFEPLAKKLKKNSKSLQQMLGPSGNPTSKSLFEMINIVQAFEKIHINVHITKQ